MGVSFTIFYETRTGCLIEIQLYSVVFFGVMCGNGVLSN